MSSIDGGRVESFSFYSIIALCFLLPVIFIPTVMDPFSYGKSLAFYLLTILSLLAWLLVRLQKETLELPKSALLAAMGGITVASLLSAIFSSSRAVSFVGAGTEVGTFAFFLFLFVLLFLTSATFQSEKKVLMFYFALFASSLIVFVYQLLHITLKIGGSSFMQSPIANLIGGWNDFGIFFGLVGLLALSFFELIKLERRFKIFLLILLLISLLAMVAVNLPTVWFTFGFFALILMVYLFSGPAIEEGNDLAYDETKNSKKLIRLSLVAILLVVFLVMGNNLVKSVVNSLGTNSLDIRPSWSATLQIAQKTMFSGVKNFIFGSGPNTFVYDWMRFKPAFVNQTVFWNTNFSSGVGHLPSMIATMGLLGVIALLTFLSCLVYCGMRVLSYTKNDQMRGLIFSSYLGALYLWASVIFYSPGAWAFILAVMMSGLFLGLLIKAEKIKVIRMSFLINQKTRFVYVLVVVLIILGSVYALSVLVEKALANNIFSAGIETFNTAGRLDQTETKLNQAVQLDPQDQYFRTISEFYLLKMNNIAGQANEQKEKQGIDFQKALGNAIDSAKSAISLNSADPTNWAQLGRVYEALASIKIQGAYDPAVSAIGEAIKLSPYDPSLPLALARLDLINGKPEDAKKHLQDSLKIKEDFAQALYLFAQIEAQQGNIKEAISRSEQVVSVAPNDLGALFQLGLLYYQSKNFDGTLAALERAVAINPSYSNARYFLGLAYDSKGMKDRALDQFKKISQLNPENQEVKTIISNLTAGKSALDTVSPPAPAPDKRATLPIDEKNDKSGLKK